MHSDGCHEEPVGFHFQEGFFESAMFDSGWVPMDSPFQVRFAVFGGGETEVDLAGTAVTFWPSPLSTAVVGTPESGRLSMDYGLEVVARMRIDVEVAGVRYMWEGDIPVGGSVPRDLRLAAMTSFDSMWLSAENPVSIADTTDSYRYEMGLIGGLMGIPRWLSGAFVVDIEAQLSASYRTMRIELGEAVRPIEVEGGVAAVLPDLGATAFGAAKDVVIQPVGQIDYEGIVRLSPGVSVEVAGRQFDLLLTSVEIPLVRLERAARFDAVTVHVPLPDISVDPGIIDFGGVLVGSSSMQSLELRNEGEAELEIRPRLAGSLFSFSSESLIVAPHSSQRLDITFTPVDSGDASGMIFFETNDPDESLVGIRLSAHGADGSLGDGGSHDGGGIGDGGIAPTHRADCSCRAGGGASRLGYLFGWLLASWVGIRQWRRRSFMRGPRRPS